RAPATAKADSMPKLRISFPPLASPPCSQTHPCTRTNHTNDTGISRGELEVFDVKTSHTMLSSVDFKLWNPSKPTRKSISQCLANGTWTPKCWWDVPGL